MRKLKVLALVLTVILVLVGCGKEDFDGKDEIGDIIEDYNESLGYKLEKNQYSGLEITGAVVEKKAILPGHPFKVDIIVKNTGDQVVHYAVGSGQAVIPSALSLVVGEMQPVEPKEHLGPMTSDFRMASLNPGESVEYTYYVAAIEEDDDFLQASFELNANGIYVGEVPLQEYQNDYPDFEPVKPGKYKAKALFLYSVGDAENPTGNPTGYMVSDLFDVTVNK